MKISELLDQEVFDSDGDSLGKVFEVVTDRSGPLVNEAIGNAPAISYLLVGRRAVWFRLGFGHREMRGPTGMPSLTRLFKGYRVPWDRVESRDDDGIDVSVAADELEPL
jgi:sporulation protein YlmC with PRC-barrel domain